MESKNSFSKIAVLVGLLMAFTTEITQAQTFGEFFNQKKTQKKYLLEQIAALQVYIGYAKKGYNIVGTGLQSIKEISSGEFGLHTAYISSLKSASPVVRKHIKIAEIIETQLKIKNAFASVASSKILSLSNQLYIQDVRGKVMDECGKDLEELLIVISSGRIEMGEKERIRRLDDIHTSITDKLGFTIDFVGQVMALINQREIEQDLIYRLRKNYEND